MIALTRRILAIFGRYKGRIQLAFVFSFLKALLSKVPIGLSFFALAAFYSGTVNTDMCLWIGVTMAACLLPQILFQHTAGRLQSTAGFMMFADKRMELSAHLRRMPIGYFTEDNIDKASSVLSIDTVLVEENCITVLVDMMSYISMQGIMLALTILFSVWLDPVFIVVVLFLLLVVEGVKKESLKDSSTRQKQNENLTGSVLDFIEGIGIIKTYNPLGERPKELSDNFRKSCRVSIQLEGNHSLWQRWLGILYGFGAVVAITISMYLNSHALLDMAFPVGIMLFVFDLFDPLKTLYSQSVRLTIMSSCMDRIEMVFVGSELPDNGKDTIPESGNIPEVQLKNVSFAYGGKEVLHNVSFDLKRNSMLALVGPPGGGKPAIAGLLTYFWGVKFEQMLIRGKDVREVELNNPMDCISMVFQRVYLFQDTIYNDISMGRPGASEAKVIEAARKARCYGLIVALPGDFQTMVGESGEALSDGERRRISVARCILKDTPTVILDEATTSVDADNESYTQQAISGLRKGKILLAVTHRLNTIRGADKILVIMNGQIAQRGTYDGLMGTDGIYRDFVMVRENNRGWS